MKPRSWIWIAVWSCVGAGCHLAGATLASSPKTTSSAGGGGGSDDRVSGAGSSTSVTVPDLVGMSREQAAAALRAAGSTATPREVVGECADSQIPHDHVCGQSPVAGGHTLSDLPIELHLQPDSPDSSTPGVAGANYAMPDVVGLTVEQARAKLAAAGFSAKDNISVLTESRCKKAGVICGSSPEAGKPTTTEATKAIYVGRDDRPSNNEAYSLFDD